MRTPISHEDVCAIVEAFAATLREAFQRQAAAFAESAERTGTRDSRIAMDLLTMANVIETARERFVAL